MTSTNTILAGLGVRKANPTEELSTDISDTLDAPQFQPKPGADLGNKLTEILGQSMSQMHSPMD